MNEKNKSEFKRFFKGLKGLVLLFSGICAGIGSLDFASVGGQGFFAVVGVISIVCTAIIGVSIFKEIYDEVGKKQEEN